MGCSCTTGATSTATLVVCDICCVEEPARASLQCSNGHTLCNACFQNQVAAWSDPATGGCGTDALRLAMDTPEGEGIPSSRVGELPCFMGCGAKINPTEVRQLLNPDSDILRDYNLACERVKEKFTLQRQAAQTLADQRRSAAIAGLKRDRSEREIFVEESILTLSCPKCHLAVLDFDGCFAVCCQGCRQYFCAWCLKFTGDSSQCHQHVKVCEENLKHQGRYGHEAGIGLTAFNTHHQERRVRLCTQFLHTEHDSGLVTRVQPVIKASLGDDASSAILRQLSFV